MSQLKLIADIHTRTRRDYLARVLNVDKAHCASVARRFDRHFWDGDRKYGYGGYHYDGRWLSFARSLLSHYDLKPGARILDIGCGKAFLLHDFLHLLPTLQVAGLDVSCYALQHAPERVRPFLCLGCATRLPWPSRTFDLVVSINALHNLPNFALVQALCEIERVSRSAKYIVVDSYRTDQEKVNLLNWQLTCASFYTPAEWDWLFQQASYQGDHDFLFYP